jgi:hypothetical protein
MRELDDLLPTLQPPCGGLVRLQWRIASQEMSRRGLRINRWAWAATACAMLASAAILIQPWIASRQRANALAAELRAAMAGHQPAHGILVTDGAAIELPSGQSNVKLYLVQAASSGAARGVAQNDMK